MIVVPSSFCVYIGKHKPKSLILDSFLTLITSPYHISIQSSINSQTSSSFAHRLRTAAQKIGKLFCYTT